MSTNAVCMEAHRASLGEVGSRGTQLHLKDSSRTSTMRSSKTRCRRRPVSFKSSHSLLSFSQRRACCCCLLDSHTWYRREGSGRDGGWAANRKKRARDRPLCRHNSLTKYAQCSRSHRAPVEFKTPTRRLLGGGPSSCFPVQGDGFADYVLQ